MYRSRHVAVASARVAAPDETLTDREGEAIAARAASTAAAASSAAVKRAVDLVGGLALLVLLAPMIAGLMALVALDGGPALFGHLRVGRHGRRFRCWKIRTMVVDAEARLARILRDDPVAAAEWARDHKLSRDPRVTRLGAFLRRSSLDELPQIWNVVIGEMSLVGPRPVTPAELEKYGTAVRDYTAVRPGLTGLWQVMGRNDLSYAQRVALDSHYVRTRSLTGDIEIMLRTVGVVVRGDGR
jgi:lipopolysaccharide/colanic/teichoic acid biosynthesis glycosyltransferase